MALSVGGSKNKSKSSQTQTTNQTQTTGLTGDAKAMLAARMEELKGQQYGALDPNAYQQYLSPFQQEVIDATSADIDASQSMALNEQRAAALARGAKGGSDRRGVYEAELGDRFGRTKATTIAGLRQAGFNTAQGIAQGENANKNTFDAGLQDRITQLLTLLAGDRVSTSTGTMKGTSKGTQTGLTAGFSYGG